MPGGDKTGPMGEGAMTGRQLGTCGNQRNRVNNNEDSYSAGQDMGCRRRFGRGRGNPGQNRSGRGNGGSFGRGFGRNS